MIAAFVVPQGKPKKKYIDLDVAINAVYEAYANGESAYDALESIPPADVRPVVLCRDCDYWNDWDSAGRESLGNYVCSCAHWTVEDGAAFYTRPTDFCSYGEKREES